MISQSQRDNQKERMEIMENETQNLENKVQNLENKIQGIEQTLRLFIMEVKKGFDKE